MLLLQVNEQKTEVINLKKKLQDSVKSLSDHKIKIQEVDEENKMLVKQLEELRLKYEEAPKKDEEENEEDGEHEGEEEGEEHENENENGEDEQ